MKLHVDKERECKWATEEARRVVAVQPSWPSSNILKGGIIRIVGILQLLTTRRWPTKSNINHRLEIQALNTPP